MLPRTDDTNSFSGFITGISVVFISGEMAGIGMLTAPWAVVNLGKSLIVITVQFLQYVSCQQLYYYFLER